MLHPSRSHGLWDKTAPPAPSTESLAGDLACDIVVIGGGYTGLSATLHLAEMGRSVMLLEAKDIGHGGAGRNVGLINAGMWVMPDDLPQALGDVHGERLLTLLGDGPQQVMQLIDRYGIACELTRTGTLHCAVGDKGLAEIEARARQWQARGADVEVLSRKDTVQRIGTEAYHGALLDRRAGTLQPLAYVRGLCDAALKAGARIFTQTPALAWQERKGRHIVSTGTGSVTADWVIVATDAYSTGPFEVVRQEQVHLPYFNLATQPLSDNIRGSILAGREGCWDTKDILSSFRMDAAGRLVFGSVGALRGSGTAIHRNWARRALNRIFPQLGTIEFEAEWYGQIGMTSNALPRFHRFADRVVGFSGYNGRGIAPGTVFGKVLADHVAGKLGEADLPLPLTPAEAQPFRAIKEAYYEAGAQIAHLAGDRF
ncbi:FAD-binding oxidoreductase [Rhizobium sp. SSA_523]|uniref:NAD(P)/FAD-dependent oxidoreductase n=1 Tax=Rhizobium sp. SSA_523 TaxID=2952477 RepID=UPI002091BAA5|nr:FAD-binding oxidoreductase [Rhizobium sp. SSA_523]MCO5734547.1 FAD-binding oxidoreductase [Rhizobium sp. SSA_523]WKC23329.1 FAD-binding oxidoreductase [Rhizobium sp. SSA_523]